MYDLINFNLHGDHNGSLVAVESNKEIPFDIKRVYYIWDTAKDVIRGHHAHKKLEQVIVCLSGSCDFILDNGMTRQTVHMDNPTKGLYLKPNIWREFTNFSPDCILLVMASSEYNPNDYIRDYQAFISSVSNGE